MGLPRSVQVPAQFRFRLSAGSATPAVDELATSIPGSLPFGPSLYALAGQTSTFGLFSLTTFISGSRLLPQVAVDHTTQSEPSTALVLAVATTTSRGRCHP
jgi:hypothetical protein